MGKLAIEGMKFYAYHGHYEAENIIGNNYVVDVYFDMDLERAGKSDKIGDTVNYEVVYRICEETMEFQFELIEKVGQYILDEITQMLSEKKDRISPVKVLVRVRKMHPPLDGYVESTSVEIEAVC